LRKANTNVKNIKINQNQSSNFIHQTFLSSIAIRNRAFARSLKYMAFIFFPENMLKKLLKYKI
jgi:hypothetical protein